MTFPRTVFAVLGCSVLSAMMAACGSSYGGRTTTNTPPPPPPPPTGTNYTTCNSTAGSSQLVPNWQSQQFISNYQAAISALITHVSQASYSSRIGYIRIGLSKGGEINLPSGWDDSSSGACYGGYTGKWVYTENSWDSYLQSMVEWEKTSGLTSQYPILVSITPITDIGTGPDDFIAQVAANNGVSFGNQGLEASDISGFPTCAGDWCNLFAQFPPTTASPIRELQTLGPSCPLGTSCTGQQQSTGPLPPLIELAAGISTPGIPMVQTPANDLELYSDDWLIAYDPTNGNYGANGAAYAAAIEAAAAAGVKMQVLFPDPSSNVSSAVLPQSSVSGVVIDVDWSDIQPSGPGSSFDFATIMDPWINQWIQAGAKQVNLVFQNTTYGGNNCSGSGGVGSNGQASSGNCAMPAWMWTVLQ